MTNQLSDKLNRGWGNDNANKFVKTKKLLDIKNKKRTAELN